MNATQVKNRNNKLKLAIAGFSGLTLVALLGVAYMSRSVISYKVTAPQLEEGMSAAEQQSKLEEMAQLDTDDVETLSKLAAMEFDGGNYQSAATRWGRVSGLSPLDPEPLYQFGRSLYLLGDLQQAESTLSDTRLEDHADSGVLLTRIAMAKGDLEAARTTLDSVLTAHPGNLDAQLLNADLSIAAKEFEKAEAIYRSLVVSTQTEIQVGAQIGLAQILFSQKDREGGVALLDQLNLNTLEAGAADAVARLYLQARETDKGVAIFKQLIEKYGTRTPWIVEVAEQLAAKGDKNGINELRASMTEVDLVSVSGRYYLDALVGYLDANCDAFLDANSWSTYQSGRPLARWLALDCASASDDIAEFEKATGAVEFAEMLEPFKERLYPIFLRRAFDKMNRGEGTFAVSLARAAQQLKEAPVEADLMLGRALLVAREFDEASAAVSAYLQHEQHRPAALEIVGRAHLEAGRPAEASEHFQQLASALPEIGLGEYWSGMAAQTMDELVVAEQQFRTAFDKGYQDKAGVALMSLLLKQERWSEVQVAAEWFVSHEDAVRRAVGEAYLAAVHSGQEQFLQAADRYMAAIELTPERVPFYIRAADNYISAKAYESAEAVLQSAQLKEPLNRYVQFKLAYNAEQSANLTLAEDRYRQLILDEPQWALPIYNLASILADEEARLSEAYRLSSRAYTLNPNWDLAEQLYKELGVKVQSAQVNAAKADS